MKEVSFMETDKISNMIKKIRQKNNLSQQKFASIYNVSFQAVSKWENGKSIPDFMTLKKICDDYDIDINDLFEGKKKSKKKKIVIGIVIILLMTIAVLSLAIFSKVNKPNDFYFKTLSTTCENFNLYGTIAYNDNKSSIYISNITYCGGDDNNLYEKVDCTLYALADKAKNEISKYTYSDSFPITLEEFLKKVDLHIDNHDGVCDEYGENDLELEIDAVDSKGNHTTYKIPLTPKDTCEND